jgi:hypothetical protein
LLGSAQTRSTAASAAAVPIIIATADATTLKHRRHFMV